MAKEGKGSQKRYEFINCKFFFVNFFSLFKGFVAIGRMYTVNPRNIELHSLRMLLLHVPGCTSYEDIRTFNGITYATFAEAALTLGLRATDNEFGDIMEEALKLHVVPSDCRSIFAMVLYYNQPDTARDVWDRFKQALSADLLQRLNCTREEAGIGGNWWS